MTPNKQALESFTKTVRGYYHDYGRDLPWRQPEADGSFDPYKIMVSELMLQQTQVNRVIPKYHEFLKSFPTLATLAAAEQGEVIRAWSGLGYNRRARYLHMAASEIVAKLGGTVPVELEQLVKLPGIGRNTAAAILVYSYGQPQAFIETNIRTVFIHHFFSDDSLVHDKDILHLVTQALPSSKQASYQNREWYWALMDYGSYLKAELGNNISRSAHYKKQSTFKGSLRQTRGAILRALSASPATRQQLQTQLQSEHLDKALNSLVSEKLVRYIGDTYQL